MALDVTQHFDQAQELDRGELWPRRYGCMKTSEKLKHILMTLSATPPAAPFIVQGVAIARPANPAAPTCISSYCYKPDPSVSEVKDITTADDDHPVKTIQLTKSHWAMVTSVVSLVQLSVTATALAMYYLIYCYMQLVYYTLKSALYFHNADGPMKVTIGVMTLTSLVVGFNILIRMERLVGCIGF